jgi:hypothetical protein
VVFEFNIVFRLALGMGGFCLGPSSIEMNDLYRGSALFTLYRGQCNERANRILRNCAEKFIPGDQQALAEAEYCAAALKLVRNSPQVS